MTAVDRIVPFPFAPRAGRRLLACVFLVITVVGCSSIRHKHAPPADASSAFVAAVNSKDIEAAMAHWSNDTLLYIQAGSGGTEIVSREDIRRNYARMFEDVDAPPLAIHVAGTEVTGSVAHEWGTFSLGDSIGCYVLLRRSVDDWKIFREWIVEPCGRDTLVR